MSRVKNTAASSSNPTSGIIANHLQEIPSSSLGSLPAMPLMKRTVQRTRARNIQHPITATCRSEIPDIFGRFFTSDKEDFLKTDIKLSSNGNDRFLIWSTKKNLEWLQSSNLSGLLKQQRLTECRMEHYISGNILPRAKSKIKATEKLKTAVQRFGSISTQEYLRGVAYNFSM
jgi:hypothetical protein